MSLIANHEIDSHLTRMTEFTNYNRSITGRVEESSTGFEYVVTHWNTEIIRCSVETDEIKSFSIPFISSTTSRLVGRIVRNLVPRNALELFLSNGVEFGTITPADSKRVLAMSYRG